LAETRYVAGDAYTIADMAIWPWYGVLTTGSLYGAAEFLDIQTYTNVLRWYDEIAARDAVKRGRIVNKTSGPLDQQLRERHDASDFDRRTQNKIEAAQ
jgi:GST-like protein